MESVIVTSAEDKTKAIATLQNFGHVQRIPATAVHAIDLALEEHLTNVLNYGFEPGDQPLITVRMEKRERDFIVEITDKGKPFNPLDRPAANVDQPLQDRPIGGLGIHLMRKFTDELTYRRDGDRNILIMRKRLT
jgi:anti-sigma regulatory factor (Ser/Thr protein kinase)